MPTWKVLMELPPPSLPREIMPVNIDCLLKINRRTAFYTLYMELLIALQEKLMNSWFLWIRRIWLLWASVFELTHSYHSSTLNLNYRIAKRSPPYTEPSTRIHFYESLDFHLFALLKKYIISIRNKIPRLDCELLVVISIYRSHQHLVLYWFLFSSENCWSILSFSEIDNVSWLHAPLSI